MNYLIYGLKKGCDHAYHRANTMNTSAKILSSTIMLVLLSGTSQAQQSPAVESANKLGVRSEDGRALITPKTGLWLVRRKQFNTKPNKPVAEQKTYLCIGAITPGPEFPLPSPLPKITTGYGFFTIPNINPQSSSKFYGGERGIFANLNGILVMGSYLLKSPILNSVTRGTVFTTINLQGTSMVGADSEYAPSSGATVQVLKDSIGTTTATFVSSTDSRCQ